MKVLEIRRNVFYCIETHNRKLLLQDESDAINWIVDTMIKCEIKSGELKIFKIETGKKEWTLKQLPDQWWTKVLAETIKRGY